MLAGCAWGVVKDAQTGEPIVGAEIKFTDQNGVTSTTTSTTAGLYAFDAAKGQTIPAVGTATFEVTAPGYDPLTVTRAISYDDGGFWEVQSFSLYPPGSTPPPAAAGLAIDADPATGGVQTARSILGGVFFPVDVVLVDPPVPVGTFTLWLFYDDTVLWAPEAPDTPGDSLDDNPDANQAALGGGWDCSIFDVDFPVADYDPGTGPGYGQAKINCWSLTGPYTFTSTNTLVSIVFYGLRAGSSSLTLGNETVVSDPGGVQFGSCDPASGIPMTCGTANIDIQ